MRVLLMAPGRTLAPERRALLSRRIRCFVAVTIAYFDLRALPSLRRASASSAPTALSLSLAADITASQCASHCFPQPSRNWHPGKDQR